MFIFLNIEKRLKLPILEKTCAKPLFKYENEKMNCDEWLILTAIANYNHFLFTPQNLK